MEQQPPFTWVDLSIYNTLSRTKERFSALRPPLVGMYVCGPTVYSDPHLGHARTAVAFDTVFRALRFLGYRVRFVRNLTDVGHLEAVRIASANARAWKSWSRWRWCNATP